MSEDILSVLTGRDTGEDLLMASSWQRPEILLNILQRRDQPLQQKKIMWFYMSIVWRLRNPVVHWCSLFIILLAILLAVKVRD